MKKVGFEKPPASSSTGFFYNLYIYMRTYKSEFYSDPESSQKELKVDRLVQEIIKKVKM